MGGNSFTEPEYTRAVSKHASSRTSVTKKAEEKALSTGKLDPQVDPAMHGVIRQTKPRFNKVEGLGYWELATGIPIPIETRLDTTGSMGSNVDRALKALPQQYMLCSSMLSPGFQLQLSTGIFGDVQDRFVLCRPKFADSADRLVERLTLMVPEGKGGGNGGEDPHYGLFGAAYLTNARINSYGLMGYDFTISDEPARYELIEEQLIRVFGQEVFLKTIENGFKINPKDLPSTKEVVQDLLKRAHAFFIQIDNDDRTTRFWKEIFGEQRVIFLSNIDYLPLVQAAVVGLTEGTLTMSTVTDFLAKNGAGKRADEIARSVAHIPIGAQAILRSKLKRNLPQKGDIFQEKTDLWPIDKDIELQSKKSDTKEADIKWL